MAALSLPICALAAPLPGGDARAGEWSSTVQIKEQVLFDDNVRLVEDPRGWVIGNKITPSITVKNETPTLKLAVGASLDHEVFAGPGADGNLRRLDRDFRAEGQKAWTRTTFGVSAQRSVRATRESELEDSGDTLEAAKRKDSRLSAQVRQKVSRRDSLNLSAGFADSAFDGAGASRFVPTTAYTVDGGWLHRVSPRDDVGVSFGASFVSSDRATGEQDSRTYRITANHNRQQSQRLRLRLGAGVSLVDQDQTTGTDDGGSLAFRFDSGLEYHGLNTTLTLDLVQDVEPSSEGGLRQSRSVGLGVNHRLNSHLDLGLGARYFSRLKDVSFFSVGDAERDFVSLEPSLAWRIAPKVSFTVSYRLRYQDDTLRGTALSNAVFVGFTVNETLLH